MMICKGSIFSPCMIMGGIVSMLVTHGACANATTSATTTTTVATTTNITDATTTTTVVPIPTPKNNVPIGFMTGYCVSGRYPITPNRVYTTYGDETTRYAVNRSLYDWTLDYGSVSYTNGGETGTIANLAITKPSPMTNSSGSPNPAVGTRLSTTTYMRYGRVTARFTPTNVAGAVTAFVTWSDVYGVSNDGEQVHDEIDWEIVGKRVWLPETNLFTWMTTNPERGLHGGPIGAYITPGVAHEFTMDWQSDKIVWSIDNVVVRILYKNQSNAVFSTSLPLNVEWFPTQPSRVQISVWDGSVGESASWAGSPFAWPDGSSVVTAPFEYVDIQCYDDAMKETTVWSTDGSGAPPKFVVDNPKMSNPTGLEPASNGSESGGSGSTGNVVFVPLSSSGAVGLRGVLCTVGVVVLQAIAMLW